MGTSSPGHRCEKLSRRIAQILFFAMVVICYARLFFQVGLAGYMDESQWVGSAALSAMGARPFFNDMYIQQIASQLYEPLVFLYYKLFGAFGILLFVRHLYFLLTLVCSYFFFKFYREKTDFATALSIAAIPLVATAWGEPSLGYNSIGGLCFGLGALFALRAVELDRRALAAWSGVAFFFSTAAYPPLVFALAVLWLTTLLSCWLTGHKVWRTFFLANAVYGILMAGFVASLIFRFGMDALEDAYRFSTAVSAGGDFWLKINYGLSLLKGFAPPLWILLPAFFLWLALWIWKRVPWICFAVPVGVWMWLQPPPEEGPFHPALMLVLAVSGIPLMVRAFAKNFARDWPEIALWKTSLLTTPVLCWASSMTLYVTFITANFCLAPILALSRYSPRLRHLPLLTMVIPLLIFSGKVLFPLDNPMMTERLEMYTSGPYAGIWDPEERYGFITQVESDIQDASRGAKSILFYDEFPLGYLMSPLYPATRTLFMHGLRESSRVRPFIRDSYNDKSFRPDLIFRFDYFMLDGRKWNVHPSQYEPYKDVFWHYLPEESGEYVLFRQRDRYSVFKKKGLP
jgi:hypothetical protein